MPTREEIKGEDPLGSFAGFEVEIRKGGICRAFIMYLGFACKRDAQATALALKTLDDLESLLKETRIKLTGI